MKSPRILALAGSQRADSYNARLLRAAAAGALAAGATVDFLDWGAHELPLFDPEVEDHALPEPVMRFRDRVASYHGLLIACPEYNASLTPLLKNAIDWGSRLVPGETRNCFDNKVAALMSASTSRFGGMRGLGHLREVLASVGVVVLPEQFALVQAHGAFAADGELRDPRNRAGAERVAARLAAVLHAWP